MAGEVSHMATYTVVVERTISHEVAVTVQAKDDEDARQKALVAASDMDTDRFDFVNKRDSVSRMYEER